MKKGILVTLILGSLFLMDTSVAQARSGCCSHHGGVCGCGCCDGTSLSSTCAPYYPECSNPTPRTVIQLPTSTPVPTKVYIPTNTPKPTPTLKPTAIPTVKPTTELTQSPTVTIKPTETIAPTIKKVEQKISKPRTQNKGFWGWLLSLFGR